MSLLQIAILALIQGAAELLPVSSSAHVIVAETLMGLDPAAPQMTFLLVMLHTGTMFAVLFYFWKRWMKLISPQFFRAIIVATAVTGIVGFGLKKLIEKVFMGGGSKAEIEQLFSNLPLIALALFSAGILIFIAGLKSNCTKSLGDGHDSAQLTDPRSARIGLVQGLCLPFRGFSRSGATISTSLLMGMPKQLAEDFSFALAVVLTPPVIVLELRRLLKARAETGVDFHMSALLAPGLFGMALSFMAGLFALKFLSSWLEKGNWKFFGAYCIVFSFFIASYGFYLHAQ